MMSGSATRRRDVILGGFAFLIMIFSLLPMIIIVPVSFSAGTGMSFPPEGLSLQWYSAALGDIVWLRALVTSALVSVLATTIAGTLGIVGAYCIARFRFPGRNALASVLVTPLVVPSVMYGLAMLLLMSSLGFRDSLTAIIVVHSIVILPYFIRVIGAMLLTADIRTLEEAARSLGGGPVTAFVRVTLPTVKPGIVAGCLFAFIMSFIEFDITAFMITADIVTVPVVIFRHLNVLYDPVVTAVSSLLLVLSVLVIVGIERVVGLEEHVRL